MGSMTTSAVIAFDSETPMEIELQVDGLHCWCPVNDRQDSFSVTLTYVPSGQLVELGWLRQYLDDCVNVTLTHEALTADLFETFVALVHPPYIQVTTVWEPVEGVGCTIRMVGGA